MNNTWNYTHFNISESDDFSRFAWNCTLVSKLNEIKGSLINKDDEISASYIFRGLLESLIYNEKPQITYRYDNSRKVFVNNDKLEILNYFYNHQEDEEWIESQKNVYLNLENIQKYIDFPNAYKSKKTIYNKLNGKFRSGRKINEDDIIYVGSLFLKENEFDLVHFHIDELKSDDSIYEYYTNNENYSLLPNLKLK